MEQNEEFKIGDIVWARLRGYPYWPSIVCNDPDSNKYMLKSTKGKKGFTYHVRFCNDNGRRSWVTILEHYNGKENFLSKYPKSLNSVKRNKKQMGMWELAVEDANRWLKFDREERWRKFYESLAISSPKPNSSLCATTSNNHSNSNISKIEDLKASYNVGEAYVALERLSISQLKKNGIKVTKSIKRKREKVKEVDDELKSPPTTKLKSNSSLSVSKSKSIPVASTSSTKSKTSSSATTSKTKPNRSSAKKSSDVTTTAKNDKKNATSKLTESQKESEIKKKANKKRNARKPKNERLNNNFDVPEEKYHVNIEDEEPLTYTHPHMKVNPQIKRDVERLEAEGIRKVREWQALQLQKKALSASTAATTSTTSSSTPSTSTAV